MNFTSIDYLKHGTTKQQEVYTVLTQCNLFENLAEFNPVLVGTFPIGIDIETSDLDIACQWKDSDLFIEKLEQLFSSYEGFNLRKFKLDNQITIIANFTVLDFEFEIFGQNIPVVEQNGFRHMIVEAKILEEKDEEFKQKIIELKKQGFKTEPAFAMLLGLSGDPYQELLKYKK